MTSHQLKRVVNQKTGKTFYYCDGKRISKNRYQFLDIFLKRKECFLTTINRGFIRHFFTGYSQ